MYYQNYRQHERQIKALQTFPLEIEKMTRKMRQIGNLEATFIKHERQIKALRTFPLEIEKMRILKFGRDLEFLQAFLSQISQIPQSAQILPQRTAKAISKAEPPKKKKAEPMSIEEAKAILKDNLL